MNEEDFILPDGVDARALPKVLLHDHLDGGLRPSTIVELAADVDFELPETDPELLAKWFRESADSGSLTSYLSTFSVTVGVMQTVQALRRIAREAVVDLAADGVVYAELRWAPEQHLSRGLTLDEAVDAVEQGIAQGIDDIESRGGWIRVQQLLCAMRQGHRSDEIAELTVTRYDSHLVPGGVCGFDLAGPEAGFPPSAHAEAFDYCAEEFVPVTVHAGEAAGLDSIESALLDAGALRLGHGIRIADDIELHDEDDEGTFAQLGELAEWVKNRRVALEIAPTSNLQTGAAPSLAAHPFNLLYELGFTVTVNTDNRLMSSTTASLELARLANEFDYDLDDLEQFQFAACEAAFLPVEDRERLADRIADGFDAVRQPDEARR
ncbi:adenosine deaminase [Gulosibacter molinativorax]|uniref:adenosine deaminase n=1 Tax=Gulosibacter molinativorax TaxID=256821 RepID=A0ABT7C834_9MICO|nr:adenosine deaminase [Gulosibacter molinativorax]MDJ1371344.1 adenosine deaminase [Gulosibacter molinativorax]QUY63592.1 Adenosine deaminase protein [Gulosibacter molinativorax]